MSALGGSYEHVPRNENMAQNGSTAQNGGYDWCWPTLHTGFTGSFSDGGSEKGGSTVANTKVVSSWIQTASTVMLLTATAFVVFSFCYYYGVFPFETFIGPVGSTVSIVGSIALFLFSGIIWYSNNCRQ